MHHIAADGWSIAPLIRDLGVAYASRCAGRAPDWAPLPVQYVDYTLWQRAHLGDLDDNDSPIAAQLGYWEQALAGLPERLQLPTDRPYPPVADQRGATVRVDWPAELQQQVARAAREHKATSFMMVQAALAVLLSKISASPEVAVGFPDRRTARPRTGRTGRVLHQHLGAACGCVGGSDRRRTVGPGAPTQRGRLREPGCAVRGAGGAAQPVEVIGASSAGSGDGGLAEFAGNSDPAAVLELEGLQVTSLPVDTHTARMDLAFSLAERWNAVGEPAGIGGTVEFRTDVFDAASIEALIGAVAAGVGGDDRRPGTAGVVDRCARRR